MIYRFKKFKNSERCPLSVALPFYLSRRRTKCFITDFKSGNGQAFSALYTRYQKPILKYVRARVSDDELAQELCQEIFLKVYRFRESYLEDYAFSTWLWTIARNSISDHLRGGKTSAENEVQASLYAVALDEIIACEKNAEGLLLKKDQRKGFLKVLRALTRPQKRVLWMRMVHHYSYPEISKKLGLSLSSVKCLAHRAKQTLMENKSLVVN